MGGGGADSGQAANGGGGGGWLNLGALGDLWGATGPGALASGGVAGSGPTETADATNTWTKKLVEKAKEKTVGQIPGYGDLWTIEGGGVKLTGAGMIAAAGAGLAVAWLVLGGRR